MTWPVWHHRFLPALLSALLLMIAALPSPLLAAREVPLRPWPAKLATPSMSLTDRDGKTWDAASLRGKVVVLNFWASWCAPCVDELPILNALTRASAATQGKLVVLGVNYKESTPAIARFLERHSFSYPIVVDKTGELFKQWTDGVMPTTILIGQDGRPRWRVVGQLDENNAAFKQALEDLLAPPIRRNIRGGPNAGR